MVASTQESLKIHKIQYDGKLNHLYKLWLVNLIFSIFTLGIYTFWGRTRVRKFVARSLTLQNDRFEYTGKGKELFLAYLKVMGVFLLLWGIYFSVHYLVLNLLDLPFIMDIIHTTLVVIYIPALFFLIYAGHYGALRYRLSKTRWRGIRFHLEGSSFSFAFFALGRAILSIFSAGLLIPKSVLEKEKWTLNKMAYGNLKFSMQYENHDLNRINIITGLLAIPTFLLSRVWFSIALYRFVYDHTHLGNLRFRFTMTPLQSLALFFKGIFLLIITFGLGYPIVLQMNLKAITRFVEIIGDLDSIKVQQSGHPELKTGEGLEGVFGEALL